MGDNVVDRHPVSQQVPKVYEHASSPARARSLHGTDKKYSLISEKSIETASVWVDLQGVGCAASPSPQLVVDKGSRETDPLAFISLAQPFGHPFNVISALNALPLD